MLQLCEGRERDRSGRRTERPQDELFSAPPRLPLLALLQLDGSSHAANVAPPAAALRAAKVRQPAMTLRSAGGALARAAICAAGTPPLAHAGCSPSAAVAAAAADLGVIVVCVFWLPSLRSGSGSGRGSASMPAHAAKTARAPLGR